MQVLILVHLEIRFTKPEGGFQKTGNPFVIYYFMLLFRTDII